MGTRLVGSAVAAVTAGVLLVLAAPGFFGVVRRAPFAQLAAFRTGTVLGVLAVCAVLVLIAVLVRRVRRLALLLVAVGLVFALLGGGVQAVRGSVAVDPRPHRLGDLRLLSWNLLRSEVEPPVVASRIAVTAPDAVSLQEVRPEDAQAVVDQLAAVGLGYSLLSAPAAAETPELGTALLISSALGAYAADASATPTGRMPSLVARPTTPERPVLVAAHAAPPTRAAIADWRSDLTRLASLCTTEEDVVVVGDLNSTVDHWHGLSGEADLGGCTDAGVAAGGAAVGTWPASAPTWLSAPIDHVAFSGNYVVSGYRVLDGADEEGSDHRPLLVQLSVRGLGKDLSR